MEIHFKLSVLLSGILSAAPGWTQIPTIEISKMVTYAC